MVVAPSVMTSVPTAAPTWPAVTTVSEKRLLPVGATPDTVSVGVTVPVPVPFRVARRELSTPPNETFSLVMERPGSGVTRLTIVPAMSAL